MAADGTLIVGASQAGVQLAISLRQLGYSAPITLVGAEPHPPYQRPPLSKAVLHGGAEADALLLRSPAFYAEQDITLVGGERIVGIERGPDGSGHATTAGGRRLPFARLALATGARPRRLDIPGAELDGVHVLRGMDHALALRDELDRARSAVVVGGGFIGLEVAASLRRHDVAVTVVCDVDRLMDRAVGPIMSEAFRVAHVARGVDVRLRTRPTRIIGDGAQKATGVLLSDGSTVPADLVVIGIGAIPRTELAEQLGLDVAGGIVVDEHCVASDGTTVAAGDCVSCPNPTGGEPAFLRFESVSTAIEQARVAAASIAGAPTPYRVTPWFWSDQYDLKLQVAGIPFDPDQTVVRGDPGSERFSVLSYRAGRLIAIECVNRPADFLAVRTALGSGRTIPAEPAADADTPLKHLVRDDPVAAGQAGAS